tara:strand:+ start:71 stop:433 length:363 start_codon:yes stop_codon:yes gene_type:complete
MEHEPYGKLMQFLSGNAKGLYKIIDPVGSLYSFFTDKSTIGGAAWRKVEYNGKVDPKENHNSFCFTAGETVGMLTATVLQILIHGTISAYPVLMDSRTYLGRRNIHLPPLEDLSSDYSMD